jgi:hypothetical protein
LKDELNLEKELGETQDPFDLIVDMRIVDKTTLRLSQTRKKVPYQIDWNLQNF